jgi:hypothetical protein
MEVILRSGGGSVIVMGVEPGRTPPPPCSGGLGNEPYPGLTSAGPLRPDRQERGAIAYTDQLARGEPWRRTIRDRTSKRPLGGGGNVVRGVWPSNRPKSEGWRGCL